MTGFNNRWHAGEERNTASEADEPRTGAEEKERNKRRGNKQQAARRISAAAPSPRVAAQ